MEFHPRLSRGVLRLGQRQEGIRFDPSTLPWMDGESPDVDAYLSKTSAENPSELVASLWHWRERGYVIFRNLIPPEWIDGYQRDLTRFLASHGSFSLQALHGDKGEIDVNQLTPDDLNHPHLRLCDFHNLSRAAKRVVMHPGVLSFVRHLLQDDIILMQTLTFLRGSEQSAHQDFPYVGPRILSHLVGSWFSLEEVSQAAGPLVLYPGSHRLPLFDFAESILLDAGREPDRERYSRFLEDQCRTARLEPFTFSASRGDVLLWHAALVHKGAPVLDRSLTRASLVAHYSSVTAYPEDLRAPGVPPSRQDWGEGRLYRHPLRSAQEDFFQ